VTFHYDRACSASGRCQFRSSPLWFESADVALQRLDRWRISVRQTSRGMSTRAGRLEQPRNLERASATCTYPCVSRAVATVLQCSDETGLQRESVLTT
jgi:hypothetical protein